MQEYTRKKNIPKKQKRGLTFLRDISDDYTISLYTLIYGTLSYLTPAAVSCRFEILIDVALFTQNQTFPYKNCNDAWILILSYVDDQFRKEMGEK